MESPWQLWLDIDHDRYSTDGRCYVVYADEIRVDVTVVTEHHQANFKEWLRRVRSLYIQKNNKNRKIVVGINARSSINCVGGSRGRKGKAMHLELLQICIGQHCLIIEIDPRAAVPHSLKAFFRDFFEDARFIFVGFEIEDIAGQLYRDYRDTDYNNMAIIPNPVDLKELAARLGEEGLEDRIRRRCKLEAFVKHTLDVDYEKPKTLAWYGQDGELSEELIMWSSLDVFFMALLGTLYTDDSFREIMFVPGIWPYIRRYFFRYKQY